jgi:hypothetical protein
MYVPFIKNIIKYSKLCHLEVVSSLLYVTCIKSSRFLECHNFKQLDKRYKDLFGSKVETSKRVPSILQLVLQ